jgi:N-acetylmuramoyl-L-alanine amidase
MGADFDSRRQLERRGFLSALGCAVLSARPAFADDAPSLEITNRLSPKNLRRPVRPATKYIVLHTTEGEENGSLSKLQRRGEAHFLVAPNGRVYRIIDRQRIATHAGRSMWEGLRVIDNYSIGIEIVGYHNHDITAAQYKSLRELLRQLKAAYRIPDQNVLTHSMVAYGRPNRFYHADHRGRKRCGMLFARPAVRAKLDLHDQPSHDPDVDGGRLTVGDPELYSYLFAPRGRRTLQPGTEVEAEAEVTPVISEPDTITRTRGAWHIAREQYDHSETVYQFPDGRQLRGNQIRDWNALPVGTKVIVEAADASEEQNFEGFIDVGEGGDDSRNIAGDSYSARSTIYFFPDGLVRTGYELQRRRSTRGMLRKLPPGTRVLVGYVYGGHVKSRRPPSSIAGHKWNYPSTYYRLPDGTVVSGDEIDAAAIPAGTLVFFQS